MAVRNFWIEADVDGRNTNLAGGPRAKDGGMVVTLKQRELGCITTPVRIECFERHGELVTEVYVNGENVASVVTER